MSLPSSLSLHFTATTAETDPEADVVPQGPFNFTQHDTILLIGRHSNSRLSRQTEFQSVYIKSPIVSRRHAQIIFEPLNSKLYIEDAGSMHGTSLNGSKLARGVKSALVSGDVITLGDVVVQEAQVHKSKSFKVTISPGQGPLASPTDAVEINSTFSVPEMSDSSACSDQDEHEYEDDIVIMEAASTPLTEPDGSRSKPLAVEDDDDIIDLTQSEPCQELPRFCPTCASDGDSCFGPGVLQDLPVFGPPFTGMFDPFVLRRPIPDIPRPPSEMPQTPSDVLQMTLELPRSPSEMHQSPSGMQPTTAEEHILCKPTPYELDTAHELIGNPSRIDQSAARITQKPKRKADDMLDDIPLKRARLEKHSYTKPFLLGMLTGSIGLLGALVSLPESLF